MFAASIFEDADSRVVEAGTADEAIIIVDAGNDVSLMFTDINIPGSMDGLMLARTVSDRWRSVRLIVTSGIVKPTIGQMPAGGSLCPQALY
ncbi:MAG: response regulator [Limisphaerales bacterium]